MYDPFYYQKAGAFAQAGKRLLGDKLKLIASFRVDKQEYFEPKVNPRLALVYSPGKIGNFRVSYQNGYRFPTLFEAFSFVDNGGIKRLGGLEVLAGQLNIVENSYTRVSQDRFNASVKDDLNKGFSESEAIKKNAGLLQKSNYGFIKPEHINSLEAGYKAVFFQDRLFVDVDVYYNTYRDFIGQVELARIDKGEIGVDSIAIYSARRSSSFQQNTRFRLWTNSTSVVTNYGGSFGLNYQSGSQWVLSGNLSFSQLNSISDKDALIPAFNTPKYISNLSVGNREILGKIGFTVSWRWQDAFAWESPLAAGSVAAYSTLDAQLNYRFLQNKATVKFGASNLLNNFYTQYVGGPAIGAMYYLTLTWDGTIH